MGIRGRLICQGWSSGFTKGARCSVQEATFESSVAEAKKGIPIILTGAEVGASQTDLK
jgi:hypothetical protein